MDYLGIPSTSNGFLDTQSDSDNFGDFSSCSFNSSDESFTPSSSRKFSTKKNDMIKNFDLLCDNDSKNSGQSFNEIDTQNRPKHHKSFTSIIKLLMNSMKHSTRSDQHQSILRRPTEYGYVRGISGLPIRVIKASSATSANHVVKR